jgi:hypothetical protein
LWRIAPTSNEGASKRRAQPAPRSSSGPQGHTRIYLANAGPGIRFSEHIEGDGATVFRHVCKLGLEGIVPKRKDAAYRSGRSPDWFKMKNPGCGATVTGRCARAGRSVFSEGNNAVIGNEASLPRQDETPLRARARGSDRESAPGEALSL